MPYFDEDRAYDPELHCPPQYARTSTHDFQTAGVTRYDAPEVFATGVGWQRHEWRPWGDEPTVNGMVAIPGTLACIHCRAVAMSRE